MLHSIKAFHVNDDKAEFSFKKGRRRLAKWRMTGEKKRKKKEAQQNPLTQGFKKALYFFLQYYREGLKTAQRAINTAILKNSSAVLSLCLKVMTTLSKFPD